MRVMWDGANAVRNHAAKTLTDNYPYSTVNLLTANLTPQLSAAVETTCGPAYLWRANNSEYLCMKYHLLPTMAGAALTCALISHGSQAAVTLDRTRAVFNGANSHEFEHHQSKQSIAISGTGVD